MGHAESSRISGTTQLLGVIGYPIAHSLSPVMHNAAIAQIGVDVVYVPFPVAPPQLAEAVAGLTALGVQGFNVTIPHKQAIIPLLSEISNVAKAIGAVNTVWRTEQGWYGTNTDVAGFLAPLYAVPADWSQKTVVVLGNGGAARAVVAGCNQLGCAAVQVVGRDAAKLQAFWQTWQQSPLAVPLSVHPWDCLPELLPYAGLVVNTTPIGMHPHAQESPLTSAQIDLLPGSAIVYDLIYTPRPTRLLQQAAPRLTLDGLEMLVQQGAAALQQWLHQPAPVDVMRAALLNHLSRPQSAIR